MATQRCPRCRGNRIRTGYHPTSIISRLFFRYNLLCNDCNWEFIGFAVPGTISSNGKRKKKTEQNLPQNGELVKEIKQTETKEIKQTEIFENNQSKNVENIEINQPQNLDGFENGVNTGETENLSFKKAGSRKIKTRKRVKIKLS